MKKLLFRLIIGVLLLSQSCNKPPHTLQCPTGPVVLGLAWVPDNPSPDRNNYLIQISYTDSPIVNGIHISTQFRMIIKADTTFEVLVPTDGLFHSISNNPGAVFQGIGILNSYTGIVTVTVIGEFTDPRLQKIACTPPSTYSISFPTTFWTPQSVMKNVMNSTLH